AGGPTGSVGPPADDIVVGGLVRQAPAVEVAPEVGRQCPVLEDVRGDPTVCLCSTPNCPAREERELQPRDQGFVAAERKVHFGRDRSELLLVGEGRDERIGACLGGGDGAANHLVERTAPAT